MTAKRQQNLSHRLANEPNVERYYTTTGSERPPRRLVRVLADMVEAAMKRVRSEKTGKK